MSGLLLVRNRLMMIMRRLMLEDLVKGRRSREVHVRWPQEEVQDVVLSPSELPRELGHPGYGAGTFG